MKSSKLLELIRTRYEAGIKRALHIESSPGIGKTQIAAQAAEALGIGFRVIHAPLLQPEDYGFPVISADRTDVSFIVSKGKFPIEGSDCPAEGILLIDELPQSDNSAQKILANLLQEREIHGQRLLPGWLIVSTGNRTQDRAGANRLLSHLKDRLTTIELESSIEDWTAWALEHEIKPEVISFLNFRPGLLNSFDANSHINATPRSWSEGVSRSLGTAPASLEFEVFKGDVGEGPAAEFCGYLKIFRDLPNVEDIFARPKEIEVPKETAIVYATCGAIAHAVSAETFGAALAFIERLPPEFSALFIRDAIKLCPAIQETEAFIQWCARNGADLLI